MVKEGFAVVLNEKRRLTNRPPASTPSNTQTVQDDSRDTPVESKDIGEETSSAITEQQIKKSQLCNAYPRSTLSMQSGDGTRQESRMKQKRSVVEEYSSSIYLLRPKATDELQEKERVEDATNSKLVK
jgi:hypothetical protein